jgi:hypothetical protein
MGCDDASARTRIDQKCLHFARSKQHMAVDRIAEEVAVDLPVAKWVKVSLLSRNHINSVGILTSCNFSTQMYPSLSPLALSHQRVLAHFISCEIHPSHSRYVSKHILPLILFLSLSFTLSFSLLHSLFFGCIFLSKFRPFPQWNP